MSKPHVAHSSGVQKVTLVQAAGSLPVAGASLQVGQPGIADSDAVGIGIVTVMVAEEGLMSVPYLILK